MLSDVPKVYIYWVADLNMNTEQSRPRKKRLQACHQNQSSGPPASQSTLIIPLSVIIVCLGFQLSQHKILGLGPLGDTGFNELPLNTLGGTLACITWWPSSGLYPTTLI